MSFSLTSRYNRKRHYTCVCFFFIYPLDLPRIKYFKSHKLSFREEIVNVLAFKIDCFPVHIELFISRKLIQSYCGLDHLAFLFFFFKNRNVVIQKTVCPLVITINSLINLYALFIFLSMLVSALLLNIEEKNNQCFYLDNMVISVPEPNAKNRDFLFLHQYTDKLLSCDNMCNRNDGLFILDTQTQFMLKESQAIILIIIGLSCIYHLY